jgi:1-acyl-sn-glycerol-3-phosphate acyltransferase
VSNNHVASTKGAGCEGEDIAIVGIGCRFPGGANSPEAFWRLLEKGFNAITDAPQSRPEFLDLFDADPKKPGRTYTRRGGFLEHIDQFDAQFFGISPREAAHIDPQHRLLLELVWEACEDAGIPPPALAGTRTGVFMGVSSHDYGGIQMYPQFRADIDMHTNSGSATSITANRISYLYDFRGPSVAVDTACSSALTALHFACQSLRTGDCDAAMAGGVQLLVTPETTIGFCKASMLSRDSECRAFDAEANGYVRSEGAGVVLLKPLSAARAAGDPIYAIIRATAINQDGHTNGMTVPSAVAQQAMIEDALAKAGVCARDVQYIEAHGTGTPIGDPIEAAAIGAVMGRDRGENEFCAIGSVKTNIGHLEASSGVAGLIKVALSLSKRKIPASLHFSKAPASIDLQAHRLRVVTKLEPWPEPDKVPIAGVNSFGFGGANAHVVLQGAEAVVRGLATEAAIPRLLTLSAKSPEALKALAFAYSDLLYALPDEEASLRDICYTAAERRAHQDCRLTVVAIRKEDFATHLLDFTSGATNASVLAGRVAPGGPQKLAFVFSGMGPQWWGMGRQLLASEPVFRRKMEACDAVLRPHSGWSLLDEFAKDEATSRVASPELAHLTNFAIQVSLADLWASWGIVPDAVMGHSGGAMAAAYVAGIYELEDAVLLAYHRSRLTGRPSNAGRMLAVGAPYADIAPLLAGSEGLVAMSAVNGPASITLTGDGDTLERICAALQEKQIFARMLAVTIAYHSHVMDKIKDEFLAAISGLKGRRARIPFVSDLTGTWASGEECDAQYWWHAVREPVLFRDAIHTMMGADLSNFVEVGPHPVLVASVLECMKEKGVKGVALPSIRRAEDERAVILRSLGSLHTLGHAVSWAALREEGSSVTALPHYPWQRSRHWFEPSAKASTWSGAGAHKAGEQPLLGTRLQCARPVWENLAGTGETAYLHEHFVQGAPVYPGAAYVEMALEWSQTTGEETGTVVRDVEFMKPLLIHPEGATVIQFARDADSGRFEVFSPTGDGAMWICHARGSVAQTKSAERPRIDLDAVRERISQVVDVDAFYATMSDRNLVYGPSFRGIRELWALNGEAVGLIEFESAGDLAGYCVHPGLLDSAFQVLVGAVDSNPGSLFEGQLYIPGNIKEFHFHAPFGARFWSIASVTKMADSSISCDIQIVSDDGSVYAEIKGFTARLVDRAGAARRDSIDQWLYDYRWEPAALEVGSGVTQAEVLGHLPVGAELNAAIARADALSVETGWHLYYDKVQDRLNELAAAYIAEAALPQLKVAAGSWRESLARQASENLQRVGAAPRASAAALAEALLRDFPGHRLDVELLGRCGSRLADVVSGRADGRDVLFTGDGFGFLEKFYQDGPAQAFYSVVAADLIADFARSFDGKRPMRVLEVGAGTGGTTSVVLPRLDAGNTSYVFSDVSQVFLDRARAKFVGDYPFVSTRMFDVTADAAAQGFEGGQYDLIVAANVIHATPEVKPCVERLHGLLAPGGALMLMEITHHPYWLDIVFGLLDGWWKFEDRERRPQHPLMTGPQWQRLLEECSFEAPGVVADSAAGDPGQSIIFGRRGVEEAPSAVARWLVFADEGGVAERLAGVLAERSIDCRLVYAADADFERLGEEVGRSDFEGIVHLWNLDAPRLDEATGDVEAFATAQRLGCESVVSILQRVIKDSPLAQRALVLVTAGAQTTDVAEAPSLLQGPVWGLGRVMRKELTQLPCRMMDLSANPTDEDVAALAVEILSDGGHAEVFEEEVVLRGGERFVHRLRPVTLAEVADAVPAVEAGPEDKWHAEMPTASFDSLVFRRTERAAPAAHEVEVAIAAASLNFRDVILGMDVIEGLEAEQSFGARRLGYDLAGTVTRCGDAVKHVRVGDEVYGMARETLASYALTDSALVVPRPERISVVEAASITCAFLSAHYALRHLARLSQGESVLIHVATGGVGLAAIQIARACGARIFATAGTPAKRAYLESIGITDVMDSRALTFGEEIAKRTGGRGVDVVLNSLRGEALEMGIAALAPYGRFVEIGKSDIYSNQRLQLLPFRKNLSFFAVDIDRMSFERSEFVSTLLNEVAVDIASGALAPIPCTEFAMKDLADAMRLMAQARHIGKVVVTNTSPVSVRAAVPEKPDVRADATYLITGGLGGVGLLTARWLVEQGARNLVLVGRNVTLDAEIELEDLRATGVRVEALAADITKAADVERVVAFIRANLPPLRGILHAAMVMADTPLAELDGSGMARVMAPKALGAWNLHCQTLGETLDFFVCFSSIVSLLGNPSQANYGAANAFLDSFAAYRRAQGLKATTINFGVLAGTGWVARQNEELQHYLDRQGFLSFNQAETLEVLSELMRHDVTQIMAARISWKAPVEFAPRAAASPRIRHLVPAADGRVAQAGKGSIRTLLESDSAAARSARLEKYLREQVAALLGATAATIEPEQPITNLGLDSLIAAELITVLDRDLGVQVAGTKLLSGISIRLLAPYVLGLLKLSAEPAEGVVETEVEPPVVVPVTEVVQQPVVVAKPFVAPVVVRVVEPVAQPVIAPVTTGTDYSALDYGAWTPAQRSIRLVSSGLIRLLGRVETEGLENIPKTGPCLLAVNHLSMADVPVVLTFLPRRAIMLAHDSLKQNRFLDWFVSDMGQAIYVAEDRVDEVSLQQALAVMHAGGVLALAPEGSRSNTGGLLRGRTGVAWLATQIDVPVVPLVAWGQEKWRERGKRLGRLPIHVRAGVPLRFPQGSATPAALRRYTDQIMARMAEMLPVEYQGVYAKQQESVREAEMVGAD